MINKVWTIAKPEKIAPATKYGGKIVVCQPGITEVATSKENQEQRFFGKIKNAKHPGFRKNFEFRTKY